MYLDGFAIVSSPSDLSSASSCEWAFLRRLDAKLGRIDDIPDEADAMLARTARLGDEHELRYLETLKQDHEVLEFPRPDRPGFAAAAAATREALLARVPVLYQATFFGDGFIGFSDFLVLNDRGEYEVYDTKLARHAKVPALLQLAAYAEKIAELGVPVGREVHLVLGDGTRSTHDLDDILPVYRVQRERLDAILVERLAATEPLAWGDPRYAACGRCSQCTVEVEAHRDLALVSNMRLEQRAILMAAGITTIDELAGSRGPVEGISQKVLTRVCRQAALQLATELHPGVPAVEVVDATALDAIPAPDDGDIFFDFEGDPLYTEDGSTWGLDYLFGSVENDERFVPFWAHDLAEERRALIDFLDYVARRRDAHPDLHIYHYAAYERSHLLSLAARHGVGEDQIDELLRDNVLVDLYPIVRQALVVGSHSYSLKKLEPLYMPGDRSGYDVANAADSIQAYVDARQVMLSGDTARGQAMLDEIGAYNEYDCVSTLHLRDWLLGLADPEAPRGPDPAEIEALVTDEYVAREPDPTALGLLATLDGVDALDRTPDQTAVALAAAAIDYHRREDKKYWQEHFDRLRLPLDEFTDVKDVFTVQCASVDRDWEPPVGRQKTWSRDLRLTVRPAPGSRLTVASPAGPLLYDHPAPVGLRSSGPGSRGYNQSVALTSVEPVPGGLQVVLTEKVSSEVDTYDVLPVVLAPAAPPRAKPQPEAIAEWGRQVLDSVDALPADPALDLLRRVPPRGQIVPVVGDDTVSAVVATLLGLDSTYLAIQGPPGTGKTYVGSHVIAELVGRHGWRVGVVGQSHSVVENILDAVVSAGLSGDVVGKELKRGAPEAERSWTEIRNGKTADFVADHREGGLVIGGTAWTFANASKIGRRALDLLVVEEAGQFSLAPTIASSVAARRILLLGDPQQLPQVSQGSHPEPVDESALGWLAAGHDVLPAEFGYFLAASRRMHPAVCAPVSRLSYAGELVSRAPERHLDGVEPGLHVSPVQHRGNTTSSVEEADRVVEIALDLLGRRWSASPGDPGRPLTDADLIVVAPYNAQVGLVREKLDAAGLTDTLVGTVDLFQGREAAVAIVTLAASSAADIPRGLDFLLMPNRLNVALSRAQWAAFLVSSPGLQTGLPRSPAELRLLSRYLGLVRGESRLAASVGSVA